MKEAQMHTYPIVDWCHFVVKSDPFPTLDKLDDEMQSYDNEKN